MNFWCKLCARIQCVKERLEYVKSIAKPGNISLKCKFTLCIIFWKELLVLGSQDIHCCIFSPCLFLELVRCKTAKFSKVNPHFAQIPKIAACYWNSNFWGLILKSQDMQAGCKIAKIPKVNSHFVPILKRAAWPDSGKLRYAGVASFLLVCF